MDPNLYKKTFKQLNVSDHIVDNLIEKTLQKKYRARKVKLRKIRIRWITALAIISITYSMTIVADPMGMFSWATRFFQPSKDKTYKDQTKMLDDVGESLGITYESKGSTLEVKSIVGDNTRCFIYFELTAPKNKAINAFDRCQFGEMKIELENEKMQENTQYSIQHSIQSVQRIQQNKLSFVMEVVTLGEVNLMGSTVKVRLKDFGQTRRDEIGREYLNTQVEGEWYLEIPINYNSAIINVTDKMEVDIEGTNATITQATLSPISLSIDYVLPYHENPANKYWPILYQYQESYLLTDKNEKLYIINDCWITRKEDKNLNTNYSCQVSYLFNEPIDIKGIKAIVIYGNEIVVK